MHVGKELMRLIVCLAILLVPAIAFAADPSLSTSDVDVVTKLWRAGSFFQLGGLALFALLVVLTKLDRKHAFYWSAGASALMIVADSIRTGSTPTMAMVVTAVTTFIALAMKGPEKPQAPAEGN